VGETEETGHISWIQRGHYIVKRAHRLEGRQRSEIERDRFREGEDTGGDQTANEEQAWTDGDYILKFLTDRAAHMNELQNHFLIAEIKTR
jgi:hypothetical protein